MKFEPHAYQRHAIDFILERPCSALFLDMGLGKTAIALSALNELFFNRFEIQKALVVAPLRVARDVWTEELEKWEHLSTLRCSVAVGSAQERKNALKAPANVYIINRENVAWLVNESGLKFDFDALIIDELSSFKNHSAKRFTALKKVRSKLKRIVGLTGTPSPNGLIDLWAQFKLIDNGERLERFVTKYREKYFVPNKTNGHIVYSYALKPNAQQAISEKISDITMSMTAAEKLKMPELIVSEYQVFLTKQELEAYNELKKRYVLEFLDGKKITATNAAVLAGKLSQAANGAVYDDEKLPVFMHDKKLDALEDLIEAANGKPLLVAYWFKHDLERLKERLKTLKVKFDEIKSEASVKAWNKGELSVGLIHPSSAGHGLNLQKGGNALVWYGLTWSLELYKQTNARLWRQGQTASVVVIRHIVAKKTIDERILSVLNGKNAEQDGLINAVKAEIGETNAF